MNFKTQKDQVTFCDIREPATSKSSSIIKIIFMSNFLCFSFPGKKVNITSDNWKKRPTIILKKTRAHNLNLSLKNEKRRREEMRMSQSFIHVN